MKKNLKIAGEILKLAKGLVGMTKQEADKVAFVMREFPNHNKVNDKVRKEVKKYKFLTLDNIKKFGQSASFMRGIDDWIDYVISQGMENVYSTSGFDYEDDKDVLNAMKHYEDMDSELYKKSRDVLEERATDLAINSVMEALYQEISSIEKAIDRSKKL
jgi:hypothetical protein